jgi:hypothetical protein
MRLQPILGQIPPPRDLAAEPRSPSSNLTFVFNEIRCIGFAGLNALGGILHYENSNSRPSQPLRDLFLSTPGNPAEGQRTPFQPHLIPLYVEFAPVEVLIL